MIFMHKLEDPLNHDFYLEKQNLFLKRCRLKNLKEDRMNQSNLVYDEVGDDFVMVNGLKLTTASSRKVMKDACEFLGIPLSGSKTTVFRRLQVAVRETAAKAALDAARNEKRAMERRPQQAEVPLAPTDEEKQRHLLSHLPFADWCEHCQATRSKDNERHERREQICPTVALDYMTTNTTIRKESPEVKHLVAVDNWSKAILAVPMQFVALSGTMTK